MHPQKVDNLIAIIDNNRQQIDGSIEQVLSLGSLSEKWKAFGWNVVEMNGNDMANILSTMENVKKLVNNGKPIMIIMNTEMGFGVDFMVGTHKWHGQAPSDDQLKSALSQLKETLGDY